MKRIVALIAVVAASATLIGCSGGSPAPMVTVTTTVTASPRPAATVTVTAAPDDAPAPSQAPGGIDLTTDAGLCAADAAMSNLELNDALAPLLGFPADRRSRTADQNDAIRAHRNAAFERACPSRAG